MRVVPLNLDTRDPEQVAQFCLGLGYEPDVVELTLVKRCHVDTSTAKIIVNRIQEAQCPDPS